MKLQLDLRSVLPLGVKTIPQLAKEIGITKTKLTHLLNPNAPTVNSSALNKVCNYLIHEGLADESDLPDKLYSRKTDQFWPMLSERSRVEFLTGSRVGDHDWQEVVSAADSLLQFSVQYQLTDDGNAKKKKKRSRQRRIIDAQLIEAWNFKPSDHERIRRAAKSRYRSFEGEKDDRGLVMMGSVKSNPVVDLSVAKCFRGARAFTSEDSVKLPNDRSVPFMLRYRNHDPHPKSCCGGMKLSRKQPGTEPGIYYEIETEAPWQHIPSNDRTDAALVFYRFDRSGTNRLEMVVGGFSGRATRCLASYLRNHDGSEFTSEEFTEGLDAGVFIVKFTFHKTNAKKKPKAAYRDGAFSTEVIPLPKEVLASRLAPRRASRSTAKKKTAAKKK